MHFCKLKQFSVLAGVCAVAVAAALVGCGGGSSNAYVSVVAWPHMRMDPQNNGRALGSGAAGNQKWTYQTGGPIFATAAIGPGNAVYVTSEDGNLYAFEPNGAVRFKINTGTTIEEAGPGIAPDGSVIFGADNHTIYCVNPVTQQIRWTFQTKGIIFSSPSFESDGTVVIGSYFVNPGVATSGPYDGNVYAINLATGKLKWSYQTGSAVGSTAAIGPDNTVYVGSDDYNMYAINGSTGALKWKFATGFVVESSPALSANGILYFGSKDDNVYALNAATGALIWSYKTGSDVVSSPAISADGSTIYVGSWDHNLYALNAATGAVDWSFATQNLGDPSPVIGSDGTIFYSSNDGHVYAINPNGTQQWAFATDPIVYTSVSVGSDGTIYEGTLTGKFYAIN